MVRAHLMELNQHVGKYTVPAEVGKFMKKLMPAAVESCCRNWKHEASCTIRPIFNDYYKNSICSCGEGKDVKDFPTDICKAGFKAIATRVALPLLSAVSYIEAMDPERTYH